MKKQKSKYSEIRAFYRFRPTIQVWITKMKGKSFLTKLPEETWYSGHLFNSGYFAFLQCKIFAIHLIFKWYQLKF